MNEQSQPELENTLKCPFCDRCFKDNGKKQYHLCGPASDPYHESSIFFNEKSFHIWDYSDSGELIDHYYYNYYDRSIRSEYGGTIIIANSFDEAIEKFKKYRILK